MNSFMRISDENLTSELTWAVSRFQISGMKNMYNTINNYSIFEILGYTMG